MAAAGRSSEWGRERLFFQVGVFTSRMETESRVSGRVGACMRMRMSFREGMNANILKCTYDVVAAPAVAMVPSFLAQRFLCVSLKRLLCSLSGGRANGR